MLIWFLFGFMCALVLLLAVAYFKFVRLSKAAKRAWMNLDNNMKNRAELIPSLVLSASAFDEMDRESLQELSRLKETCRHTQELQKRVACEADVTKRFKQVFTAAARHAEMQTDEHFLKLQKSIIYAEGQVQSAKRKYNSAARDFNTLADVIPLNLIAQMCEMDHFAYFDFDSSLPKAER